MSETTATLLEDQELIGSTLLEGYTPLYRHLEMKTAAEVYDCWVDFATNKITLFKKVDGAITGIPEVISLTDKLPARFYECTYTMLAEASYIATASASSPVLSADEPVPAAETAKGDNEA